MKFIVGDSVKIVDHPDTEHDRGDVGKVIEILPDNIPYRYNVEVDGKGDGFYNDNEIVYNGKPNYLKKHLRLITIELDAKQERLQAYHQKK